MKNTEELAREHIRLEEFVLMDKDELCEKLAAIEHERWAAWQNWVHKVYLEGNFGEFMLRWQKQINTPYAELSDKEKASDMEQVDRYWPLIEAFVAERERIARTDERNRILTNLKKVLKHANHMIDVTTIEMFIMAEGLEALHTEEGA